MVEAAYGLMSTRGYLDTTMADIAAEAGVAVQTVYFTFHNKPAVLRAAFEFAVTGDHLPGGPAQRAWFAAMEQERDLERALVILVDATSAIFRRIVPLWPVFTVLADDPEIDSFYQMNRRLTRDGYRLVIASLMGKRPLRIGLSPEDATTILLVLLGTDVYRSMLEDHGWPEQKWRSWVIETLSEALFGRPATG
jgi:AcrR family transcriptional regulator